MADFDDDGGRAAERAGGRAAERKFEACKSK